VERGTPAWRQARAEAAAGLGNTLLARPTPTAARLRRGPGSDRRCRVRRARARSSYHRAAKDQATGPVRADGHGPEDDAAWLERRGGTLDDCVFPSRNDYMAP